MSRKKRNARRTTKRKKSYKGNTAAFCIANLEQIVRDESVGKEEHTPLASPCCIHVHSKRNYLADADGISAKAVIDGIVHSGLLQDDGPKDVSRVTFSQEKSKDEETIIIIYED